MNKEFVTYEQALALKELGFDEPCFAFFTWKNELKPIKQIEDVFNSIKNSEVNTTYCSAVTPTFSQAFRWFREKHNLYGYTLPRGNNETQKLHFTNNIDIRENIFYETLEEAEIACLIKLIEIVKTNNS